ncbi:MOSC domain-containing protein [Streptomyces halobius]|uniref:MOSC N-terminal beta barrel domain-containing protein n=1 Tax=Streptomyces halobius TaxID=2879846 RepID=A0ABY4M9F0_9ACTN|nr:MOSC N-terminal beta barrel domain-containing protein [Streptomyces halobius]UQA93404.1 MOSC N-terminal beta barrel domain-containing protein [Streptomyces halobius]
MPTVAELITYPVKGCAGVPLAEAGLTPAGLPHDRSFMVVDGRGVYRTQRKDPLLALIRPEVGSDGTRLTLRAPGADPVHVEVDTTSPRVDVDLFGKPFRGIDQGGAAAGWLSEVLGTDCRLVRVPPEHDRVADGLVPGTSGYADSSPLHILSLATLDELNARFAAGGKPPLPMTRFRPNIVLDGWDEPHLEDRVRRAEAGGAELGFAKLAVRCAVTMVDQESGTKAGPEPLRIFATYRRVPEGGVAFGSKFSVVRTGKLAVGEEFRVTEWAEEAADAGA